MVTIRNGSAMGCNHGEVLVSKAKRENLHVMEEHKVREMRDGKVQVSGFWAWSCLALSFSSLPTHRSFEIIMEY